MRLKIHKLYHIEWIDTVADSKWRNLATIKDMAEKHHILSVGWFIYENKNYYVFCSTYGEDFNDEYSNALFIPKGMIRKIKMLKD
jgi:hypothetical protein